MSASDHPPIGLGPGYLRTEFLERIAHELRGPAGVTSGALDEIDLAVSADATQLREYLGMARRGVQRVLRVAERLQRTAQLERGQVEWAMAPTDLRRVVEQAASQAGLLEGRRGVRVDVSCSDDPCPVSVDPAWIRFSVAELVGNAIRFARSATTVECSISGDEVTVTIADDGPGFARAPANRFEPPLDRRGVGLSLHLVRDAVAAHGGRLELDAARGSGEAELSGARVVLALPRAERSGR
ncbi:MAG: HAMP domain-containing histidine kinase [Myxococcales bacterium]|nr:HAMP domain-containing histidine kinase [Myxococcales bacterium]